MSDGTMTAAQTLIGVGLLVALVSLLADPLRMGRYPGVGARKAVRARPALLRGSDE